MSILTASDLTKAYAGTPVLSGVMFNVEPEEKVALIGRNGSGKTTLLQIVAGLEDPDSGHVSRPRWVRVGYLAQIPLGPGDIDVLSHALSGAADVRALEGRLRDLETQMAAADVYGDPSRLAEVMDEYAQVRHHFEHAGGFTLEARARSVLGGLGFAAGEMSKPLGVLSGGWRVRAELARVLLAEPDVLLLDEPTNHLDLAATEWLEEYLAAFPGAAVIVSHDRRLLDTVTTRTLELEQGNVTSFPGAYSQYASLKAAQLEQQADAYQRRQDEVEKLEAYVRRYRAGQRAAQAKSREKRLARLTASPIEPPRGQPVMRPAARAITPSGRIVVRLEGVNKRYTGADVFAAVDLMITRGERVGLLGANGAGKTTLLKMIGGVEPPSGGRVILGSGLRMRYHAQESSSTLREDQTVLDEVLRGRSLTPEQARTYLGRFLFSREDVFKLGAMLSGGERQRLSLAILLLDQPNVLLLDEPTNHLDIPSREALEAALLEFPGTMVIATHDRYLLERLATRILTVEGGHLHDFHGTYDQLKTRRTHTSSAGKKSWRGRQSTVGPSGRGSKPKTPTFEDIAAQIAVTERDLAEAGGLLADPELYRDGKRAKAVRTRYEEAERRLQDLYRQLAALENTNA